MNIESSHLSFVQVADLVEGRLSAETQVQAQAHTATCSHCAAELTWLTHLLALMRDDTGEDAPPHVVDRAADLFRKRLMPDLPSVRQRRSAALRFDSWRRAPMGLRGGARSERQLLFNIDAFDIDVRISGSNEVWTVTGQVLGPDHTGAVVLQGAGGRIQGVLNELSEFKLSPVPPGAYTLIMQLPSVDIEIAGLEVGV